MLFKKRNVNQQNAAAIPAGIPRPPQTIIHQAPSEAGRIFAWAIVIGVAGLIGWNVLLSLLEEMGARNPAEALGWFIFGGAGLLLVSIAVDKTLTKYYKMKREFDERIEEIRAERDRSLALTAAQPRPNESRLTGEDSKFAALLRMVMSEAYRHLDKEGQYSYGEPKPWVRRANTGKKVPGFDDPVTEVMAADVSRWLREKGVIDKNGIINIDESRGYPSFAHFEALLESEFYVPIQVNKALSPLLRNEVSFVEK